MFFFYLGFLKLTMFKNNWKSLIEHWERSYVYILSGQKLIKNAKNCPFWRVFENLKLSVKQNYQTGQFKWDKNWWKMPKFKSSTATFWVIFKQCEADNLLLNTSSLLQVKTCTLYSLRKGIPVIDKNYF